MPTVPTFLMYGVRAQLEQNGYWPPSSVSLTCHSEQPPRFRYAFEIVLASVSELDS